jgi:iron complex outermembrane recepter protein
MLVKKLSVLCLVVMLSVAAMAQQQKGLSGRVTEKSGKPLGYVTVRVLNTNATAMSDAAGNFSIPGISPGNYDVEISHVGFTSITESVQVRENAGATFVFVLQDQAVQLEDIVVTADKREQVLQKTPGSISAFSSRDVQQYRLWNSKELTALVPNLYANNSGDDRNVTSIRGITTTSYDPAVAVYVDGVNQFSLDTYIPQLADIERIEVLRGPQGSLYGRNAMGGVINIITKQPGNTLNGFAEVSVGVMDYKGTMPGSGHRL